MGSVFEVFEEGWAKPAFHLVLGRVVPVATIFRAAPFEFDGVAGEGCGREKEGEAVGGIGEVGDEAVDHKIDARNKWLAEEADGGVVEDPRSVVAIGRNDEEAVHKIILAGAEVCNTSTRHRSNVKREK